MKSNSYLISCRVNTISLFSVLVAVLIIGPVVQLHGQNFRQSIERMKKQYAEVQNMHIVMNISTFEDSLSTTANYSQSAEIKRMDNNFWYRHDVNEMLLNSSYLIVLDRDTKQMIYSHTDTKASAQLSEVMPMNLDSIFSVIGTPIFLGHANGVDHYKIKSGGDMITTVHIFLNESKGFVQELMYDYKEGQRARIEFKVFNMNAQFDTDAFDEKKYFTVANGRITLASGFKNYVLMEAGQSGF